ncbi:hypothetical protein ABF681_000150 [Campylobacter upsaliensis]|nr:hypothetical protein [Campylobacter upsaliensis]EFQ4878554.1 hypothetical protein [Campylobacter upsaliensis]EGK8066673.1 hypothetical protein [Campylobacter upsaliensis]EIL6895355.1 hypothetical protein [Campylobacter upsaliensis]ELZ7568302.1 hypothetical protein [Campylobacter upsaliensis]
MLKRVLGKANSKQNTALRSKGTAWDLAGFRWDFGKSAGFGRVVPLGLLL